jgi:hypothetical protein
MKRLLPHFVTVSLLSFTLGGIASADTLISNLGQPTVTAAEGFAGTTIRYAWDFQTGVNAASATTLTLRLLNLDTVNHNITAQIWTNNGLNQPGAFVGAFSDIIVPAFTPPSSDLTGNTLGIPLSANTIYWIVTGMAEPLANSPFAPGHEMVSSGQAVDAGGVFSTVASTDFLFSADSGATWPLTSSNNAFFKLEGTVVPEPGSTLLFLIGLSPGLLRRRR